MCRIGEKEYMKKILFAILISGTFLGSAVSYMYGSRQKSNQIANRTNVKINENAWIITGKPAYPVTPNDEQWKKYQTHDQMVAACNPPKMMLKTLSTKELAELMVEYPLLGDLMLFDNINIGIEIMSQECSILAELIERDDGSEQLLNAYNNLTSEKKIVPQYIITKLQEKMN